MTKLKKTSLIMFHNYILVVNIYIKSIIYQKSVGIQNFDTSIKPLGDGQSYDWE